MQGQEGSSDQQGDCRYAAAVITEPTTHGANSDNQKIGYDWGSFVARAHDKKTRGRED